MARQCSEIALIPISADVDLSGGESGKIWKETLTTVSSQPGALAVYWGREVEHPEVVQLVVDWDDLQSHKNFIANPIYGPFFKHLEPLLSGEIQIYHAHFPEDAPFSTIAAAPVVECITLYLDSAHDEEAYNASFATFKTEGEKTAHEARGLTGGWGVEEHQHDKFGKVEGEKGPAKLFAAFIGWTSVEAHLEYRKTEHFPGVVKYLRDGPKDVEVHHTPFQKF